MEIDSKHKISLEGFTEQPLPWQCPNCSEEMDAKSIIGFGLYPLGGWQARMKPNCTKGVGFECPICFTKSCFHNTDESTYKLFLDINRFI